MEKSTSRAVTFVPPGVSRQDEEIEQIVSGERPHSETSDRDVLDMRRLGRKQELRRVLKPVGLFFWFSVAQALWPFLTLSIDATLINGGRAGLFWGFVVHTILSFPLVLSITELACMAPTAGAFYHWISEFAPASIQKPLSYLVGWCNLLAYLSGTSSGMLLNGILVQSLIGIVNPSTALASERWPVIAFVAIEALCGLVLNIWGFKIMPNIQWLFFLVFIGGWLLIIISIPIAVSPKATAEQVFLDFSNLAGWNSITLAFFVGQITPIYSVIGYDNMVHVIEEVQNASKTVAWAAPASCIFNGVLNLVMVLVLVFALPSVKTGIEADNNFGYAFIYIIRKLPWQSLQIIILISIIVALLGANINYTMSLSREVYAFARGKQQTGKYINQGALQLTIWLVLDSGLPYSRYLSRVDKRRNIPTIAVLWATFCTFALCLIYLGNITAYYAIASLNSLALLFCYLCAVGSMLWRRLRRTPLDQLNKRSGISKSPFLSEKIMRLCNIETLAYVSWCLFWVPWPLYPHPDVELINWSPVVFAVVLIISLAWYFGYGRRKYRAPRELIRTD